MVVDIEDNDIKVEFNKRGEVRKRKPKQSINYFTQETEDAILKYVSSIDDDERNQIYNDRIDYAFHKLAENIIHTFKFYYTEVDTLKELKHEVVVFLLSKLHLYRAEKGKAYSYFGTIAKRYLILYNEANYKKLKEKGALEEADDDKRVFNSIMREADEEELITFVDYFIAYVDVNLSKIFTKVIDIKIADAIIELFKNREILEIFNKKAIYIYIREIVDVKTPQITKIINKLKTIYKKLLNEYYLTGTINIYKYS